MLNTIKGQAVGAGRHDWEAPGGHHHRRKAAQTKAFKVRTWCGSRTSGALGSRRDQEGAPSTNLKQIYQYFHAEEQRQCQRRTALMRAMGKLFEAGDEMPLPNNNIRLVIEWLDRWFDSMPIFNARHRHPRSGDRTGRRGRQIPARRGVRPGCATRGSGTSTPMNHAISRSRFRVLDDARRRPDAQDHHHRGGRDPGLTVVDPRPAGLLTPAHPDDRQHRRHGSVRGQVSQRRAALRQGRRTQFQHPTPAGLPHVKYHFGLGDQSLRASSPSSSSPSRWARSSTSSRSVFGKVLSWSKELTY